MLSVSPVSFNPACRPVNFGFNPEKVTKCLEGEPIKITPPTSKEEAATLIKLLKNLVAGKQPLGLRGEAAAEARNLREMGVIPNAYVG